MLLPGVRICATLIGNFWMYIISQYKLSYCTDLACCNVIIVSAVLVVSCCRCIQFMMWRLATVRAYRFSLLPFFYMYVMLIAILSLSFLFCFFICCWCLNRHRKPPQHDDPSNVSDPGLPARPVSDVAEPRASRSLSAFVVQSRSQLVHKLFQFLSTCVCTQELYLSTSFS